MLPQLLQRLRRPALPKAGSGCNPHQGDHEPESRYFVPGYHRTLEDLFHQVQREVINAMMDTAIIIIVDALLNAVRKCFNATEEQMNLLLVEYISELPESWKARFQLPASA